MFTCIIISTFLCHLKTFVLNIIYINAYKSISIFKNKNRGMFPWQLFIFFEHHWKWLDRTSKSYWVIVPIHLDTHHTSRYPFRQLWEKPTQMITCLVRFRWSPWASVCVLVCTSVRFLVSHQTELRPADSHEVFVIVRQPGGYTTGWISLSCYSNGERHGR